jgi:hypothetical protein
MFSRLLALVFLLAAGVAAAAPTVTAPDSAAAGSQVTVTVTGSTNPRDFVTIVPKGMRVGGYNAYQYVSGSAPLKLVVPSDAGDYEVRLLSAETPYPTLASRPMKVTDVSASVQGPATVAAGAKFEARWTGPNNERDYVAIGDKDRKYITYVYTRTGSPAALVAPEKAGDYELRYILGNGDKVVASQAFTVGSVTASVTAPAQVAAGAKFNVQWKGPNNPRDFITIVPADAPEKRYEGYQYTSKGATLDLQAPDKPGEYEVRYLTAQSYLTLGTAKVTVTAVTASIQGPAEAVAGSAFPVTWKGPNNPGDYVTIVQKDAREGHFGSWDFTARGSPSRLVAPLVPGDYELRYSTGQSHATLARTSLRITPAKEEPGLISVSATSTASANGAVEIILDASGSMLQRIGNQRRIDIAKQTLTKLTSSVIPAGTPFAMRAFGREVDSCQTDLEIPVSPLDAGAAGAKIAKLEAKNGAKTPIGASLALVASDLKSVSGERLVVLLTDGEETCGGDPAAEIEKLKKAGVNVRVSIVGFALEDEKLAATFQHWASTGGGSFFAANDAAGLNAALSQAMRPAFEVVNGQGQVVSEGIAGGDAVRVMPGSYTVRLKGQKGAPQSATVTAKTTTQVKF